MGNKIRFKSEWEDKVYEQWGKVLDFLPYNLIRYSLFALRSGMEDEPEYYFIMSYILNEEENTTLLTIEQNDNRLETGNQESYEEDENSVLFVLNELVEAP